MKGKPTAMPESFEPGEYLFHLLRRWRTVASACAVALLTAAFGSLLLPKQYTSTARVLIVPPGSSDGRVLPELSPAYLESLKTYEYLALGDKLFEQAFEKVNISGLDRREWLLRKNSILSARIPAGTKILEVTAKLPEPAQAQKLASYVAAETVRLSEASKLEAVRQGTAEFEKMVEAAKQRVHLAERNSLDISSRHPVAGMSEELQGLIEARVSLLQEAVSAEMRVSEIRGREISLGASDDISSVPQADSTRQERRAAETRLAGLKRQLADLDRQIHTVRSALGSGRAGAAAAEAERNAAWAELEEVQLHLSRARAASGARGDQLQMIDSGVVPVAASEPKILLNVAAAGLVAIVLAIVYLTLQFGSRLRSAGVEASSRVAGHG